MAHARFRIRKRSTDEQLNARRATHGCDRIGDMAKGKRQLVEVRCPCCEAKLQIDAELQAVISYEEHKKPPAIEDIGEAVQKLKGEEARRDEVFQKSFEQHKGHQKVLERKFDELLKQAKENPDASKPKRPFDFD
jgi:predicted nuclease with TOPRIM domain